MNYAIQSIINMNRHANKQLNDALTGRHSIYVQQESPTYAMNEDGEFHCRHDRATVERPCCTTSGTSGYIDCACGGRQAIYCPDCENQDLSDNDIEQILGGSDE